MKINPKPKAIITIVVIALISSAFSSQPQMEASGISFYCKWKVRYNGNSGYNLRTYYFITDVKTIEGDDRCISLNFSELNDKMIEQIKYNFPDLVKNPAGFHNFDGGNLRIEVVTDESRNEVDRLRRNDISAIRDQMKSDDKLNNFIFDLDDLNCD